MVQTKRDHTDDKFAHIALLELVDVRLGRVQTSIAGVALLAKDVDEDVGVSAGAALRARVHRHRVVDHCTAQQPREPAPPRTVNCRSRNINLIRNTMHVYQLCSTMRQRTWLLFLDVIAVCRHLAHDLLVAFVRRQPATARERVVLLKYISYNPILFLKFYPHSYYFSNFTFIIHS